MTADTSGRLAHLARAAAPAAFLLAIISILLRFPPAQYSFYPQCPIHHYLHILCPGCGTTRAMAALLHGDFAEALRFNALTTLFIPVALIYGAAGYWRTFASESLRWPQPPPPAIYATLAATAAFTIARNF